jgi:hypothetical protein
MNHFTSPHFPQNPFTGAHLSIRAFHRLTPSRSPFTNSSFSVIISQAHMTLSQAHTFQKSFHKVKLFSYHFTSPHFSQDPFTGSHLSEVLSQAQAFQLSFHKPTFFTRPFHRLTHFGSPFTSSSFTVIISQAHIFHKTLPQAHP